MTDPREALASIRARADTATEAGYTEPNPDPYPAWNFIDADVPALLAFAEAVLNLASDCDLMVRDQFYIDASRLAALAREHLGRNR